MSLVRRKMSERWRLKYNHHNNQVIMQPLSIYHSISFIFNYPENLNGKENFQKNLTFMCSEEKIFVVLVRENFISVLYECKVILSQVKYFIFLWENVHEKTLFFLNFSILFSFPFKVCGKKQFARLWTDNFFTWEKWVKFLSLIMWWNFLFFLPLSFLAELIWCFFNEFFHEIKKKKQERIYWILIQREIMNEKCQWTF